MTALLQAALALLLLASQQGVPPGLRTQAVSVAQAALAIVAQHPDSQGPTNQPALAPVTNTPSPLGATPTSTTQAPFTIDFVETPTLSGGRIVFVPKRGGEAIRDSRYDGNPLKLFAKAEIVIAGEIVRTYTNTPTAEPTAKDSYSFGFPGTTVEKKELVELRVTMDGETVTASVPVQ